MKKFLSLFLALIMLFIPLSALADYSDGFNCEDCGHYHWDSYACGVCGRCSDDCTNNDCHLRNHCSSCGECFMDMEENNYCTECGECRECYDESSHCKFCGECGAEVCDCGICAECLEYSGAVCTECNKCLNCEGKSWENICQSCGTCDDCALICPFCHNTCTVCADELQCQECGACGVCAPDTTLCDDCGHCILHFEEPHCEACRSCIDEIHDCGYCVDCLSFSGYLCDSCGACTKCGDGVDPAKYCPECGICNVEYGDLCADRKHCDQDYDILCDGCGACNICFEDVICENCNASCKECSEFCSICTLCVECCLQNSIDEGCSHGICVEDSLFDDPTHRCSECSDCFEEDEFCEDCGLCGECCLNASISAGCEHGICVESSDFSDTNHICQECGDCFDSDYFCEDCETCLNCCLTNSENAGCEHGVCANSSDWDDHFCTDCETCIEEECPICGGCSNCCQIARDAESCTHEWTCPSDSSWDEHMCSGSCGSCYEPDEMCTDCGYCIACCRENTLCTCGDYICAESSDFSDHYCYVHKMCFTNCPHGTHTHTPNGTFESDAVSHWQTCSDCGNKTAISSHAPTDWIVERTPTQSQDGLQVKKCSICWRVLESRSVKYVNLCAGGFHIPSGWEYNENSHWAHCSICQCLIDWTWESHSVDPETKTCSGCDYTTVAKPVIGTVGGLPTIDNGSYRKAQKDFTVNGQNNLTIPFTIEQGENIKISLLDPKTYKPIFIESLPKKPTAEQIKMYKSTRPLVSAQGVTLQFNNSLFRQYFNVKLGKCGTYEFILRAYNETECPSDVHINVVRPHKISDWHTNTAQHWKVCEYDNCQNSDGTYDKGTHDWRNGDSCAVCSMMRPTRITFQPNVLKPTYRYGRNNKVPISIKARGLNLKYQWHYAYMRDGQIKLGSAIKENTTDPTTIYYEGTTTDTLTFEMYSDMCGEVIYDEYEFTFVCVITGDGGVVESKPIQVMPQHDTSSYSYDNAITVLNKDPSMHAIFCKNCNTHFFNKPHTPGYWKTSKEPTVDAEGVQTFYCADCGLTNQTKPIPKLAAPHEHDFSVVAHDLEAHWKICSDEKCKLADGNYEKHIYSDWSVVQAPTSSARGLRKRICSVEGCWCEQTAPIAPLAHICSFENSSYSNDDKNHWIKCENADCSKTTRLAPHRFESINIVRKPTTTEEGYGYHNCSVCMFSEYITLPKIPEKPVMRLYSAESGETRIHAANGGMPASVMIASYKDGRLVDVKRRTIGSINPMFDAPLDDFGVVKDGADEVRVFMLSSYKTLIPTMPAVVQKILPSPTQKSLKLYSENGVNKIYASGGGGTAHVYIGSYKNKKLIDLKEERLTTEKPALDAAVSELGLNVSDAEYIKAYIFKNPTDIVPMLPFEKLNLKAE